MQAVSWYCVCFGLLSALAFTGCSAEEPAGLTVSGNVTLKGQPLDQGTIEFSPAADGPGSFSGAPIKDGKYEIPALSGLQPGKYTVRISSGEGGTDAPEEAPGESERPPAKERIPASYNSNSTQQVEVKVGAENKFDFNIP